MSHKQKRVLIWCAILAWGIFILRDYIWYQR